MIYVWRHRAIHAGYCDLLLGVPTYLPHRGRMQVMWYPILRSSCSFGFYSLVLTACALQILPLGQCEAEEKFTPEAIEWFEREVRPLLSEHCSSCHSDVVGTKKGGLSLASREAMLVGGESGPSVVPGDPEASLLVEAIRRESFEMPPEKPLSKRDRETLEQWVEMGAPWSEKLGNDTGDNWFQERLDSHWAWSKVEDVAPPAINDDWSERSLDRFILRGLQERGLSPADDASDQVLVRRLSFDLLGVPPSSDLVSIVVDHQKLDSAKLSQVVDELLASPQFGVRWGRHWLDLVRYAETLGHEFDYPAKHAWRYRDAVVSSLNSDVPYSQFVGEHIAGDQLPPRANPLTKDNEALALTGWWWLGDSVHAPVDITNDWATRIDNQVDVFSKTFLGLTVACARCHEHKFDAIRQADYYALVGVIESTRREYANTDPGGRISDHYRSMANEIEKADAAADVILESAQPSTSDATQWIRRLSTKLGELEPKKLEEALPLSSPLYPLRLRIDDSKASIGELVAAMARKFETAQSSFAKWESESELYIDFTNEAQDGIPAGWTVDSPESIGDMLHRYDWFSGGLPVPRRNVFSSRNKGVSSFMTLRSPDFKVSRTAVCIKMRGKAVQTHVVVSNYFMQEFHSLLFKDLRKESNLTGTGQWVTHKGDLNKYRGHPAFLSVEDTGDAWFEIEEIRFADRAPPVEPSPIAREFIQQVKERAGEEEYKTEQFEEDFAQFLLGVVSERRDTDTSVAVFEASDRFEIPLPIDRVAELESSAKKLSSMDRNSSRPTVVLAAAEGTARNVAIALRGNPHQLGDIVSRGCLPDALGEQQPGDTSSGRLELARILTSASNPLTARVMVNRVWQQMFGRGLVASPDNFGVLGGRPSHPELLDYLSSEFMKHDWSIKWLVREIALSRTYRLSSRRSESHAEEDPASELLSHRMVRRLSAEAVRDSLLSAADALDMRLGGESTSVYLNDQMTGRGRPKKSGPLDGDGRRSVYIEVRRNFLNPFLVAFDFPMPSTSAGRRNVSNVPAQALGMLNDPLVVEVAQRMASGLAHMDDSQERIVVMYQRCFGRYPSDAELQSCEDFVAAQDVQSAWVDLAHVLLNSKEFLYLR